MAQCNYPDKLVLCRCRNWRHRSQAWVRVGKFRESWSDLYFRPFHHWGCL